MKNILLMLAILASASCVTTDDFAVTFAEWQQRLNAKPKTGYAWPAEDIRLDHALGGQAHRHERFLAEQLKSNPNVYQILDASPVLCQKYRISPPATNAFVVEERQQIWLKALAGKTSQQGAAPLPPAPQAGPSEGAR